MQIDLLLTCGGCTKKHQNYRTSRTKNPQGEKLSLKKYCRFCQKTQIHKEEIIKKKSKKKKPRS